MADNRYLYVQQSVDARQSVKFRDRATGNRVVIGIQANDVGEMILVDKDENEVAHLSSNTNDFDMIPENAGEGIQERVVVRLHGEKSRLWPLKVLETTQTIDLDENAQVILKGQALYGTLLLRDSLGEDRLSGRAPHLSYWMGVSTTRGDPPEDPLTEEDLQ